MTEREALAKPLRIALVEDHALFRRGLAHALSDAGHDVVAEAADLRRGRDVVTRMRPDVALIDVRLPDGDGIAFCAWMADHAPTVAGIMLSTFSERGYVEAAIGSGARAYVAKDVAPAELCSLVERVVREPEGRWFPLIDAARLTPREQQVAAHLVCGDSNGDIAEAIGIGAETVKDHVSNVLGKLGARDRAEAAVLLIRLGYVR
ncbi:MAG: response regulator transcription factor [Thioalkalivibrio sp.]|nr:response regulator transcription factor [Thioalkalivibrio sp.]